MEPDEREAIGDDRVIQQRRQVLHRGPGVSGVRSVQQHAERLEPPRQLVGDVCQAILGNLITVTAIWLVRDRRRPDVDTLTQHEKVDEAGDVLDIVVIVLWEQQPSTGAIGGELGGPAPHSKRDTDASAIETLHEAPTVGILWRAQHRGVDLGSKLVGRQLGWRGGQQTGVDTRNCGLERIQDLASEQAAKSGATP